MQRFDPARRLHTELARPGAFIIILGDGISPSSVLIFAISRQVFDLGIVCAPLPAICSLLLGATLPDCAGRKPSLSFCFC